MNLLFICSRNQWRSPTAERIWARQDGINARSASTSQSARRRVNGKDILWADMIFVMEPHHKARLASDFRIELRHTPIHVLDIPDDYAFMDPELITLLQDACEPLIQAAGAGGL